MVTPILSGVCLSHLCLCVSPDGSTLYSGSNDKTIKLWSLPSGSMLVSLCGHSSSVRGLCVSPDGSEGLDNPKSRHMKVIV